MSVNLVKFRVISNREIAEHIRVLTVTSDQGTSFLAGQYYSFKIDDKTNRSYSVASNPNKKELEFLVKIVEGGKGSDFVKNLKTDDKFQAIGPLGFFTLENSGVLKDENPLVFVATGTGIAPIRSMILHLLKDLKSSRQIKLFFGLRYDNQAYYFDEFENLEKDNSNFHFVPIISRPSSEWKGFVGHCQDYIKKEPVNEQAKVFICGSNVSVQSISTDLIECGYKKENIFFEKFG